MPNDDTGLFLTRSATKHLDSDVVARIVTEGLSASVDTPDRHGHPLVLYFLDHPPGSNVLHCVRVTSRDDGSWLAYHANVATPEERAVYQRAYG